MCVGEVGPSPFSKICSLLLKDLCFIFISKDHCKFPLKKFFFLLSCKLLSFMCDFYVFDVVSKNRRRRRYWFLSVIGETQASEVYP